MVLGFDEPRPTRVNYQRFLDDFVTCLEIEPIKGLSLMLYGSYVRGDAVFGRSDIDGVLIFPDDVIINKPDLMKVSGIFARANAGNNIPFQVTVSDLRTMTEGTFNSFVPKFKPYFDEEGVVLVGPDYRTDFVYSRPEALDDQVSLIFNLRKARQGLFFAEYDSQTNYRRLLEHFNKSLDAVSRASKQIPALIDGRVRRNRFSAIDEIKEMFPEVDIRQLIAIRDLYHDTNKLDKLYRDTDEVLVVWQESLTFFESLIKAYLDRKVKT